MAFPIIFFLPAIPDTSSLSVTIDANTWLLALISGCMLIIGFFTNRWMRSVDDNYKKLDSKIDRVLDKFEKKVDEGFKGFDTRLDAIEVNQAVMMSQKKKP